MAVLFPCISFCFFGSVACVLRSGAEHFSHSRRGQCGLLIVVIVEPTVCYYQFFSLRSYQVSCHITMAQSVHVHSAFLHSRRLHSLCRVCGGRSSKSTKPRAPILCRYAAQELDRFFGVNVSLDCPDVHSSTLCSRCYGTVIGLKSSASPSQTTMERGRSEAGKAAHLWKEFDGTVAVADCGVCSTFTSQMKGGRPPKRKRATPTVRQNTSPDNFDVSASQQEFLPQDAFKSTKSPHSRILTDMQTSPISLKDHTMETCIQTSPLKTQAQGKPSLRPINELSSPLSKEEEAYMTQLIRIKLSDSEDKTTVRCRTRGQPLVLKK